MHSHTLKEKIEALNLILRRIMTRRKASLLIEPGLKNDGEGGDRYVRNDLSNKMTSTFYVRGER